MNADLIFYLAHQTANNQTVLTAALSRLDISLMNIKNTSHAADLKTALTQSLKKSNVAVIIGGQNEPLERRPSSVIFSALSIPFSGTCPKGVTELNNEDFTGYFIPGKNKVILILPDEPTALTAMFEEKVLKLLADTFQLTLQKVENKSINLEDAIVNSFDKMKNSFHPF